ncbi:SurA N-terminal domain-containing protein [Hephaestia sp. GCM10023244]|uniref:peptidylprolyl isomerase n=1 Tax=unclassified Hephaestia TaxID=2631281 RepID=UPI00207781DB|nr:peptidylprolyl isomerase [Hephaestia sp. MAHUQ-44]MCM8730352.1 SurA N-terminal domain-containing protein [Hephaestia sp. MAHUQ-44]
MLGIIRKITGSKIGLVITFIVLGVIAIAFAAGDMMGITPSSSGIAPTTVATVGGTSIDETALRDGVQQDLQNYRQQQPQLDITTFVAGGGIEGALSRLIDGVAFSQFAEDQGMRVSKRLVDGQIASIPALQGPDGKFSLEIYKNVLAQQRLTDAALRADMTREIITRQLIVPTVGATQVPMQVALPYAALLLEKRQGHVGFVPTSAAPAGKAPTDAEIATFYGHESARYTVPERRVMHYAIVTSDRVADAAKPTDADISKAYEEHKDRFAAKETRTLKQVIVADRAAADALAKSVTAGTAIDAAARAAGLEASTIADVQKQDYAKQASAAAADAAFAAAQGAVVGPVQTPFGFAIARVEKVTRVPGQTLAEARATLTSEVAAAKLQEAMADLRDSIDESIVDGSTFAEIAADKKLTAQTTAPLTTTGVNPLDPASTPNPALAQVVAAGFDAQEGDAPQLVAVGQDGSFALVTLDRVVAAAPRPLAEIRDRVVADFQADRARTAVRGIAAAIVAKVNKGESLAKALGEAGVKLPAPEPLNATRAQLLQNRNGAPPPLALMFAMAEKNAKQLEAPGGQGFYIVVLDKIERVDPKGHNDVISAARADLSRQVGAEYAEQFAEAVRRHVGVQRNAKAIADVRAALTGEDVQ